MWATDITIVDCGIGNIRSVQRMFEAVDASATIVSDPALLAEANRVVLPGVGAFDAGMAALRDGGWIAPLNRFAMEQRRPLLGICLGMQLLCRRSEEGTATGLGWIAADVVEIDLGGHPGLKLPHMGWAVVTPSQVNPLVPDDGEQRFYHVHRYRAVCDDPADELCTSHYGTIFTTGLMHGNVLGLQFHPEKSHRFGMGVMRRFASLAC